MNVQVKYRTHHISHFLLWHSSPPDQTISLGPILNSRSVDHVFPNYQSQLSLFGCKVGWTGMEPDFATSIARLLVRLLPVAAVYQCQLSVPSLRGRLMIPAKAGK